MLNQGGGAGSTGRQVTTGRSVWLIPSIHVCAMMMTRANLAARSLILSAAVGSGMLVLSSGGVSADDGVVDASLKSAFTKSIEDRRVMSWEIAEKI